MLGDMNVHFWLLQRMAQATKTDLFGSMQRAQLTQEDWAKMVTKCRRCDWTEGCQRWLELHQQSDVVKAPSNCVNKERFWKLRKASEAQK
ncbi:DUF6455 family protein [Pseudopelagicola sp. nBUS_19]|uniref:DUF6455 family protein n=1 Tax=unclassified Pseudopelagicola TaxID=2649563 RepID=UPI003EB8B4EF